MATVETKLMTAEEFFDWAHRPENRDRHFELEAGEVVQMAQPGERHGVVCGNSAWILGSYVRSVKPGYVCTNDTGLVLERDPDTVRGADIALYLGERKFQELSVKYSDRLPDLAVEVFSPTDRVSKMLRRISLFLAKGVKMVWLLDPEERNITVSRPGQAAIIFEHGEEITGLDVLPDFRCKVAEFFVMPGEARPVG